MIYNNELSSVIDDIYAQTDRLYSKEKNTTLYYFIAAHTLNGGRFYSEVFKTFAEAFTAYSSYIDMVKYFNGGYVELFRINNEDFDIVSISRI